MSSVHFMKSRHCLLRSRAPIRRIRLFFVQGRRQYLDTSHLGSRNPRAGFLWVDVFMQRVPEALSRPPAGVVAALRRSVRWCAATLWAEGQVSASLINKRLLLFRLFQSVAFCFICCEHQAAYLAGKLLNV